MSLTSDVRQTRVFLWRENMLLYLSSDIISSEKQTVLRECNLRKTEIRGTDNVQGKYQSIFSCQMEAIVFSIPQKFFPKRTALKIGKYHSDIPQF